MKVQWSKWNSGGKMIFISLCISVFSFFLAWVDIGITSRNAINQGTFLLVILYLYPVITIFKNRIMKKTIGIFMSVISIVCVISYIMSKQMILFEKSVNASGVGPFVFIIGSIILLIGVIKYSPFLKSRDSLQSK